ncbi:MAG: PAS domain S-box protein [Desulfovibrio sp.]|nr:MAG: PAS domain S-box protein [Desulfovibrio sp.]
MDQLSPLIIDAIIDSMPVGVMVVGPQGRMLLTNATLETTLGLSRDQFQSKGWAELFIHENKNIEFNQIFLDVIRQELVNLTRSVPFERADGEVRRLIVTSSYLKHEGKTHGIVLLIMDVTDKHALNEREKELLLANSQIQSERGESLKNLALSVAHQIRNPIMNIGGFSNLMLKDQALEAGHRDRLATIIDQASRLENIVRGVTDYASLPLLQPQKVQALGLMEAACADLVSASKDLGKHVDIQDKVVDAEVIADPVLLKRALDEILRNALDFSNSDSVNVEATFNSRPDGFLILVTDRGPGMDPDHLPFAFDPFFTTKTRGVGMGLPIAKRIVMEHRGDITLANRPGGGLSARMFIRQGEDGCRLPGPA